MIVGGDTTGGAVLSAAEIYDIDGVVTDPGEEEPPIEEEPVEPPIEEEPVTPPPPLTFADFADLPIPGLTLIATELPPGLSLVSLTGIVPLLAAIEAEELSAAQDDDGQFPLRPFLRALFDEDVRVNTAVFHARATIGVERVIHPTTGDGFSPGAPDIVNRLTTVGVEPVWLFAPDGGWYFDAFWSDEQIVKIPDRSERPSDFVGISYTGPTVVPANVGALGLDERVDLDTFPVIFLWGPSSEWLAFRTGSGVPAILQTAPGFATGDALLPLVLNDTAIELTIPPPDQTFGQRCSGIAILGDDEIYLSPTDEGGQPPSTMSEVAGVGQALLFQAFQILPEVDESSVVSFCVAGGP